MKKTFARKIVLFFRSTFLARLSLLLGLPALGMVSTHAINTQNNEQAAPVPISKVVEKLSAPIAPVYNKEAFYWKVIYVQKGETVGSILSSLGAEGKEAETFIYANPVSKNLTRLHIGQPVSVYMNDKGGVSAVQFLNDNENGEKVLVAIEKKDGKWQATTDEVETETIQTVKMIRVRTSARGNLAQEGVPADIRESLNEIFSNQFALTDLKENDVIRLIYESFYYRGQEIATGNILAVNITHNDKSYSAYYFAHHESAGSYYDAGGEMLKKGFEFNPVISYTRISSFFGMRKHPILGGYRFHSGIDYAAPSGTPIMAPADGTIIERGVKGGYGNAVMLEHKNGMQTLYAHMSQFRANQSLGMHVKAGSVIGYVGSTGRSTGPHLHYEVRLNGQAVDPSTSALPTPSLNSVQLKGYYLTQEKLEQKLALMKHDTLSKPVASMNLERELYLFGRDLPQESATLTNPEQKLSLLRQSAKPYDFAQKMLLSKNS